LRPRLPARLGRAHGEPPPRRPDRAEAQYDLPLHPRDLGGWLGFRGLGRLRRDRARRPPLLRLPRGARGQDMNRAAPALRLDAVDLRILAALQREGRIAKSALAERVGLSATPSWQRLKRLERAGLIRGYRAELALDRIAPFATVLVEIILKQHRYA